MLLCVLRVNYLLVVQVFEFLEELSTSLSDLAAKELAILKELKVSPILIVYCTHFQMSTV